MVVVVYLMVIFVVFMLCSKDCLFRCFGGVADFSVILYQPEKLAMVEHNIVLGRRILLNSTSIHARKSSDKFKQQPHPINRKDRFSLSLSSIL